MLFRSHTQVLPFRQPVSQVPVLDEDMVERVLQRLERLLSPLPFQFTLPDGDAVPPHPCQLFLFLPVSLPIA